MELLACARACREYEVHLPLVLRSVLRASAEARIVIIGQASGKKVHETGMMRQAIGYDTG